MIWWITACFIAFFVKGICGFANSLVFSTMLSFHANNVEITPVEVVLGYPANILMAFKERKSIRKDIAVPLSGAAIFGSITGVFVLKYTNVRVVKIIFGFVIAAIALNMLREEFTVKKRTKSKVLSGVLGILGGILCGMYGIGALLGAYVSSRGINGSAFKGTVSLVFSIENTMRIILSVTLGIITLNEVKKALVLIPVMLAGMGLGMVCSRFIEDRIARRMVIILLILSGAALIVQNLFV